jgi:hypothetical protein
VNGWWLRAAGAGRQCAPAALVGRFRAAPQLHSKDFPVVSTVVRSSGSFDCRCSFEGEKDRLRNSNRPFR